jgi:hypothetical protein
VLNATIRYYGDSTQSRYFDPMFFDYLETFGYTEDSIVLLYRSNPLENWSLFSDYELITTPAADNWQGRIKIGNLLSGQYTWAVPNSPLLNPQVVSNGIKIYTSAGKLHGYGLDALGTVSITDNSGRSVYSADCEYQFTIDTTSWAKGIYHVHIGSMVMNILYTFKVYIP